MVPGRLAHGVSSLFLAPVAAKFLLAWGLFTAVGGMLGVWCQLPV